MVNSFELYQMLATTPAKLWNLNDRGKLIAGMKADILIANSLDDIFDEESYPFSVIVKNGQIRVLGNEMAHVMDKEFTDKMDKLKIREKEVLVQSGLNTLTDAILTYYPEAAFPFELIHA
jgi:adenine deaminase